MSFGFGGNNNNQSAFGGGGGFGSSNTGGGFGASNNATSGGSLFGGNTATSGGFGGFGSTNANANSSPFGGANKPFGASATSSGGGLFGSNTATSGAFGGGGGFGGSTNTGGGFGNTSGGLFGQNKPATTGFGSNTGGSLFGSNNATGGFGSSTTGSANPFASNTTAPTSFGSSNTGGGNFTFGGGNTAANNNSGTSGTPFQPFSEKDGTSNSTSLYQSITFQQPYQNKSFEELRTEDYAQGRRFGNTNGQAGSFGQSTGFGGFGQSNTTTSGGLFGSNTATAGSTGFGSNTGGGFGSTNTGGFGSSTNTNTGGGLFGNQNKPATGGLFGATSSTAATGGFGSTSGSGGGLFGSGGGGFGSTTNTNTNAGGGLFGNNQQQQNKPAFGGFGSTNNNTSGFGASTNTNTGGGLFGGSNPNAGSSLFGQNNQQQQQSQSTPFGQTNTNTGGGLFGNQNKPAGGGLFGSNTNTNTGGNLFGAQNNQQQSNPFGASTNTGGGLFGQQNQNKPAGTGLFGSSQNTGGSLFGNQPAQQSGSNLFGSTNTNTGGGLFGQNKPAGGGLFGNTNTSNTGSGLSLFGNQQQNQQGNPGSSLFGNQNQNQQSTNTNSLFGGSLGQSQQIGQQNQLHASLTSAPYGNEQLFSSLAAHAPPVGPLATPLSGARPTPKKTPSLLASARLNTPVYTPRGSSMGRGAGYGFSYSTYGTPGSAYTSGSLTPGANSLLRPTGSLSSALTSRLNKSLSTSNLRGDSTTGIGTSLLRPGAFSPEGTPGRYTNGSVRKLKIDRSLRTDLFGPAPEPKAIEAAKENDGHSLRKTVSFDNAAEKEGATPEANASNALVRTEDEEDEAPGLIRAGPSKSKGKDKPPEMEQVNGTNGALTTVPEETETIRPSSAPGTKVPAEKKRQMLGDYWTKPPIKDLKNMSRQQLKNVNFTVGRQGVGRIEFGPVDLTNTPLEDICDDIVQLNPRSATVYKEDQDKPRMGQALNVPSTIYLEHSWARSHGGKKQVTAKSGKEYDKHIARLKRVAGTHFISYDPETGVWAFKVDHFTTYGLDDDDDESEFYDDSHMQGESSALSDPPQTPTEQQDITLQSVETPTQPMDDTFQFKLDRRSQLSVPGGFESEGISYDYDDPSGDEVMEEDDHMMSGGLGDTEVDDPFTSPGGAVQAPSPNAMDRYHSSMMDEEEEVAEESEHMPGSFVAEPKAPKSILKPSTGLAALTSPEKLVTETWEEQLQRTISPKKRDRQALKEMQQSFLRAREDDVAESPFKQNLLGQSTLGQSYLAQKSAQKSKTTTRSAAEKEKSLSKSQAFETSMDIMGSLWNQEKSSKKTGAALKGFEFPYPKKPRLSASESMSPEDAEWHDSFKPSFTNNGILTYSISASAPQVSGGLMPAMQPIIGEHEDIRFAKFVPAEDINSLTLFAQKEATTIDISSGFPSAHAPEGIVFNSLADNVDATFTIADRERSIWRLCSILFDPQDLACGKFMKGVPEDQVEQFAPRMRMDALGAFWARLVALDVEKGLRRARSAEEKAILYLTQNNIVAACEVLMDAKDFKLAALVAQLPGTEQSRAMMKTQIGVWRERNDWSEMSDAVRALYSILAGQLSVVEAKMGAAENRVAGFNIAEHFGLSWEQSFALRVYFGGFQTISEAIIAYIEEVRSNRETVQPNAAGTDSTDTLMAIMMLFSAEGDTTDLFNPQVVCGNAMNSRMTWQLATLLSAKGHCTLTDDQLDQITYAFGSELEFAGKIVTSAWVLIHLRNDRARIDAITELLQRHGESISTPGQDEGPGTLESLTQDNQIPSPLVWRAKALYAKGALQNPGLQTEWLLRAGDVDDAHEVLCTTVGPQAVIEQDYDWLNNLLQHFRSRSVEGWEQGGQVYVDFLRLVQARGARKYGREALASQDRLKRGLAAMEEDGSMKKSLEERVAIIEMEKVLQAALREQDHVEEDKQMGGMDDSGARAGEVDLLMRYQRAMASAA